MPYTYGDAITQARQILQDTRESSGFRYETSDLIGYLNNALLDAYRLRPDAFFPDYEIPHVTEDELGDDFVPDSRLFLPVVMFIAGMAEIRDDEFASDGRAITVMNQFVSKLRTAEA